MDPEDRCDRRVKIKRIQSIVVLKKSKYLFEYIDLKCVANTVYGENKQE